MLRECAQWLVAIGVCACGETANPSSGSTDAGADTEGAELGDTAATTASAATEAVADSTGASDSPTATDGTSAVGTTATDSPDTVDDTGIPAGEGWTEIANTRLAEVCPPDTPDYDFSFHCQAVITAWNGGIGDTARDRLIVWGGGHNDYYGNELYALDVDAQAMVRLNDPSPIGECVTELADGAANSRHTYDGLTYIEHADRMFVFGGAWACPPGGVSTDTWTLDMETLTWTSMDPPVGGPPGAYPGVVSDYDPVTQTVLLHDTNAFWRYEYEANRYTQLADSYIDYHMTGRIDPVRREFVIAGCSGCGGGGLHRISIADGSDFALETITDQVSGCEDLLAAPSPGLDWDASQERLVGWGGGSDVFVLDLEAMACERYTAEGGPGPAVQNGTFGRWRYFPDEDVFVVVNDWQTNSFAFRF